MLTTLEYIYGILCLIVGTYTLISWIIGFIHGARLGYIESKSARLTLLERTYFGESIALRTLRRLRILQKIASAFRMRVYLSRINRRIEAAEHSLEIFLEVRDGILTPNTITTSPPPTTFLPPKTIH